MSNLGFGCGSIDCVTGSVYITLEINMRFLQDLRDSLPSDPFEADLLAMAEAVAQASSEAETEQIKSTAVLLNYLCYSVKLLHLILCILNQESV